MGGEHTRRIYRNEEDFLEEFRGTVEALLPFLDGAWEPNYSCSQKDRAMRDRLLATGRLEKLTFEDAAIFHTNSGFSSLQIHLRSSHRLVIVRVHFDGGRLAVKKLVDREVLGRPHAQFRAELLPPITKTATTDHR